MPIEENRIAQLKYFHVFINETKQLSLKIDKINGWNVKQLFDLLYKNSIFCINVHWTLLSLCYSFCLAKHITFYLGDNIRLNDDTFQNIAAAIVVFEHVRWSHCVVVYIQAGDLINCICTLLI